MKHEGGFRSIFRTEWKQKLGEKLYNSVIAKRFKRFTNWLYSLLINGFFGKLFTAYSAEEELFWNSRIVRSFVRGRRVRRVASGVKSGMAQVFESSSILIALGEMVSSLIHRKLKTYGAFLLSLGAYGIVTYIVRVYVLEMGSVDSTVVVTCLAFLLLAFPLMASRDTFASAAQKSKLMSLLLFEGLGIPRDSFAVEKSFPKRYSLVTAMGMILGALTFFIHPVYYVLTALLLLGVALVFTYPEIGVLGLIALVPLSAFHSHPSMLLFWVVVVNCVSYFVKLIRGKRVAKFGLVDFSVLLFALVTLLGGLFGAGGTASFESAILYFVLFFGYFLTVNLIRTQEWVRRCIVTLLIFGGVSAIIGVIQIFTGSLDASWIDSEMFSDISVRITGTFDNPNVYASYLLLVLPFVPVILLQKNSSVKKSPFVVGFLLLMICLVETWSRGAWLGFAVAFVLFFLICSRRSLPYLLLGGVLLPIGATLLPDNIVSRALSIGSASDSSSMYRISAWKGVMTMLEEHWLGGIGVGEAAFSTVYPAFSYAGIEGIRHAHNLYLQILSETGIAGLLMLVIVLILFVQNCFEYIYKVRKEAETAVVIAGLAAVVASLIMGLTDHIWYNYRVFLMFWLVIGLVNAYIRIGLSEFNRSNVQAANTLYSVNFDMNVDNL